MKRTPLIAVFWTLALSTPAFAQTIDGTLTIPAEFDIRDRGWSQLTNLDEMREFILALVEAMAMTAVLAFHPRSVAHRRGSSDWEHPQAMFLYALVGLVVGFLVIHHGVLIGFVIFGIGSLFRFRMETLTTSHTAQMIFVSLIGLSVGLDLPVMALLLTLAAAVVMSVFSRSTHLAMEIKFEKAADFSDNIAQLREALSAAGFTTQTVTKSKFKPVAEIVLSSSAANPRETLVDMMTNHQKSEGSGVEDWHIE